MNSNIAVKKDVQKREVTLERVLDGPQRIVWQCLTTASCIDQWWGPEGWTTETKVMEVRVGGTWHYCMSGHGLEIWGIATYETVQEPNKLSYIECPSNAVGEKLADKQQHVLITVNPKGSEQATITICIRFASVADLEAMAQLGMVEGYDGALDKLQRLIKKEQHGTD